MLHKWDKDVYVQLVMFLFGGGGGGGGGRGGDIN